MLMLTINRPFGIFPNLQKSREWLDNQPVPEGTPPGGATPSGEELDLQKDWSHADANSSTELP
jgi:hypothetical protein